MILNFRLEQEFGLKEPIDISCAAMIFSDVCKNFDFMLETQKKWFEKGHSRKQALQHQIFEQESISKDVQARWEKRYKKISLFLVRVYGMARLMRIVPGSI
ncbi:hypothetical protein GJY03_20820 [Salmonella enterica]|nr:hypothetical protein [Salmonella enterica subsp. arizonae serovar 40:z36:-]EEC2699475.1 hypothetical protein [Salmonella enterica]EEL2496400.1 hypothetical protein [Salmonella enterica]EEP5158813.1 hypothetical protein [Salmonella enterica]EFB0104292.1 hypothetical protein [Salmonella enterica]